MNYFERPAYERCPRVGGEALRVIGESRRAENEAQLALEVRSSRGEDIEPAWLLALARDAYRYYDLPLFASVEMALESGVIEDLDRTTLVELTEAELNSEAERERWLDDWLEQAWMDMASDIDVVGRTSRRPGRRFGGPSPIYLECHAKRAEHGPIWPDPGRIWPWKSDSPTNPAGKHPFVGELVVPKTSKTPQIGPIAARKLADKRIHLGRSG